MSELNVAILNDRRTSQGAEGLLIQGFHAIRMHVGLPDLNKDVERVRAASEMLGLDVVLLVDTAQLIA